MTRALVGAAAAVVLAAAFVSLWLREGQGSVVALPSVEPADAPAPAQLTVDAVARAVRLPEELHRRYPPRTRVAFATSLDPRDFTVGIGCPGGGFLPLLNGVPAAQPLHRNLESDGPVPLVIGKFVDEEGSDWYVHADGSETTTRWTSVVVEGVARRDVRTDHTVPARAEHGLSNGGSVDLPPTKPSKQ